jgi:hypothetical protein
MGNTIKYKLRIALRLRHIGRPDFGHEPSADTQAERSLRRQVRLARLARRGAMLGTRQQKQGVAITNCILPDINGSERLDSSPRGKQAWLIEP